MKTAITLLAILILAQAANAVRVGVVVGYPDGTTDTECVNVNTGTDGYNTLEQSSLDITWSGPSMWGHGLCGIGDVGCPSDDCYCGGANYWGFLLAEHGDSSYNYMPVGFDAPSECWNHDYASYTGHYCAADGDVIVLAYGPWGTQPKFVKFTDICGPERRSSKRSERQIQVAASTDQPKAGEEITLTLTDMLRGEEINKAQVGVYEGTPGASKKLFEGETNKEGKVSLTINEVGEYRMRLSASDYPHKYMSLKIVRNDVEETNAETTSIMASTTTVVVEPFPQTTTVEATSTLIETTSIESVSEPTSTVKLIPPKPKASFKEKEATTTIREKSLASILGFAIQEQGSSGKAGLMLLAFLGVAIIASTRKKKE